MEEINDAMFTGVYILYGTLSSLWKIKGIYCITVTT